MQSLQEGLPSADFSKCFGKITYAMNDLKPEDDVYPVAPDKMFFWMMFEFTRMGYNYILQRELDVIPIAENWLDTIVGTARNYTSGAAVRPWVIGAGMHFGLKGLINGNAIYVNDVGFLEVLHRYEEKLQSQGFLPFFDIDMRGFVESQGLDPKDRFIITPRIVHCAARLSLSEDSCPVSCETVLVHPGHDHVSETAEGTFGRWADLRSASCDNPIVADGGALVADSGAIVSQNTTSAML